MKGDVVWLSDRLEKKKITEGVFLRRCLAINGVLILLETDGSPQDDLLATSLVINKGRKREGGLGRVAERWEKVTASWFSYGKAVVRVVKHELHKGGQGGVTRALLKFREKSGVRPAERSKKGETKGKEKEEKLREAGPAWHPCPWWCRSRSGRT